MKKLLCLSMLLAVGAFAQKGRPQRMVTITAGGTGNAITGTAAPAIAAYTDMDTTPPMVLCFEATAANTAGVTIALNGLAAKSLYKLAGAINTALAANDIRVGQWVCAKRYVTGDAFQMITPTGNAAAGGGGLTGLTWYTEVGNRGLLAGLGAQSMTPKVSHNLTQAYSGADTTGTKGLLAFTEAGGSTQVLVWNTRVPDAYTSGTLSLSFSGQSTSSTGNMRWVPDVSCPAYGAALPGAGADFTYNTAGALTVAGSTNWTEATVTGIAMTGCTAGNPMLIRLRRLPADALDTSTADYYISDLKAVL